MKSKVPKIVEKARIRKGSFASDESYGFNGAFVFKRGRYELRVICSDEMGWDHVSVSLENRTPTWAEMCFIKNLFFDESETVIQYYPKKSKYINVNPYVLHMWKKQGVDYELPQRKFI